jgi:two-component system chemotaxis sensor kinase CheA
VQTQDASVTWFRKIGRAIVLPERISDFERSYLRKMNRVGFVFFLLHVPAILVIAAVNGIDLGVTAALLAGALALPILAFFSFENPRSISITFGVTAMLLAGILVHVGQGPVQIEMHFHFFVLIALLAVYANPLVILAAAVTVASHHLAIYIVAPRSVFNYDAAWWVVAVHAAFVVIESVAACFIARSFFDNVIGLEKIVEERTVELGHRNGRMRRVLDNVQQGFLDVDREGRIGPESSAIVTRWFGEFAPGTLLADLLRRADARVADGFEVGFSQVVDGLLPIEVAIDQLPRELEWDDRSFALSYTALAEAGDEITGVLTIITETTEHRAREKLEAEQRETARVFQCITRDKTAFLEFWDEADRYVRAIAESHDEDPSILKRNLHTLKGNAAVYGLRTLSDQLHDIEERVLEEGRLGAADRHALVGGWKRVHSILDSFLGDRGPDRRLEIEESELDTALLSLVKKDPHAQIAKRLQSWRLEPVKRRFQHIAEQLRGLAVRLGRGDLEVVLDDGAVLFDPTRWTGLWASFVHLARNAVDHGIEPAGERLERGKPATGRVELRASVEDGEAIIVITDDGRGVDWDAVSRKAREHGLPADSHADRIAALFHDGISTRAVTTELSGRGVGMGAIQAAAMAMGGRIEVTSQLGVGTTVTLHIPLDDGMSAVRAA